MKRRYISSGSDFETLAGYSRAVIDGDYVHVSGTTGFDYTDMTIKEDIVEQVHQVFRNIESALQQADCSLDDVIRVHYYLVDAAAFRQAAPLFGKYFSKARPAATAVVVGLVDPRMKIEIEVTARRVSPVQIT